MAPSETLFRLDHPAETDRRILGALTLPESIPEGGVPYVLVLHGFKGFFRWGFFPELCRRLAESGMAAVSFNTSGSGVGEDLESFEDDEGFSRNTFSRELEDLAQVRIEVEGGKWSAINHHKGGIFGHSRGGGLALLHAAAHPGLRVAATWAAIDRVDRWDADTVEQWRARGYMAVPNARTGQVHRVGLDALRDIEENRERLDIRAACARLALPTLLVHGAEDEAVDPAGLERLLEASPAEWVRGRRIADAGHTFGARHPLEEIPAALEEVLTDTVAWLAGHLVGSMGQPEGAAS